jgi:hypothetical protein
MPLEFYYADEDVAIYRCKIGSDVEVFVSHLQKGGMGDAVVRATGQTLEKAKKAIEDAD